MSPSPPVSYVPLDAAGAATDTEAEEVWVSTVAATAVATGHLMLKLEGYKWLKAMHGENGSYIESSPFAVGGHTWRILCYLNGCSKEDAGFVSLYLMLCNDAVVVRAEYELALVRHRYGHQGMLSKKSEGLRTFGFGGEDDKRGWGRPRFISVKELERSGFVEDDCLVVRCTVTVVEERTAVEKVVVQVDDLAILCKCDDDLCKRHHARPTETFMERFANFCYSICHGTR